MNAIAMDSGGRAPAAVGADAGATTAPVALFDFDGVLVRGDTFHQFLRERYAAAPWRCALVLACTPVLCVQWLGWRLAAWRLLGRIALLGVHEARYQALVDGFAVRLVRRSRTCCRDGLRTLRRRVQAGERVLVVTGCEGRLARAIFRELGLADVVIVAAEWRDGWSGMHLVRHNTGAYKVRALAAMQLDAWQVAYSDSLLDAPMLARAAEPVLVNATPAECRRLERLLRRPVSRVQWY